MVQKTYITKKLKENIEDESLVWARNYIAKEYHSQFNTPQSKKEIDAAMHNMEEIMKRIVWMEDFAKKFARK